MERYDLYRVDLKYIRDLSKKEHKVMSVSPQIGKETRPFLGIVIMLNERKYCIPITSANKKDKFINNKVHGIDCIKILDESRKDEHGAPLVIAVLNINNMIPIRESLIQKIDISTNKNCPKEEIGIRTVMQKELKWCRENAELIQRRAQKVYNLVLEGNSKDKKLLSRCNDFKVLEQVLDKLLLSRGKHTPTEEKIPADSEKGQQMLTGIFGRKAIAEHAQKIYSKPPERSKPDKNKGQGIE